ncbi:hypothetical protein M408DRAFT_175009 [Serendipita vermifera MAFF 305830]|uniref:Uncharacterized protein n=1 Tax=Serendipita vermifera MAFF 305830 TaxID=933852 RepID=A0A0C3B3X0_SERVB|nr:hypothetical protein M408DRAFT_175009 [Serendipita vermifera MAFF 305830]
MRFIGSVRVVVFVVAVDVLAWLFLLICLCCLGGTPCPLDWDRIPDKKIGLHHKFDDTTSGVGDKTEKPSQADKQCE